MRLLRCALVLSIVVCGGVPSSAQQKGQWVPGQFGLNAGVIPQPGFTYQNLALNYSADALNDANGNGLPRITGTYQFWVDENIFVFVPKYKFLGGYFSPWASVNLANGSLVAELVGTILSGNGGGEGLADTVVAPFNMGWHFSRLDLSAGYAFVAPTGRYTFGARDNVGSGYWGNNLISGATFYVTKNKGTSANVYMDWEGHGKKSGTNITPGQAVTMEWGLGQALPLDKELTKILQIGLVGYDQWQVTDNSGVTRLLPYYSGHALGAQGNFIAPKRGLTFFFKYYGEYAAKAGPQGRTIVFGGSWTLKIPKP
ncbi:MAG TPA: transporter [Candidatus Sulfotelmatobacter sp.]|nr:transporter [Candidatus Sulfotelmatobacter sp.]